MFKLIHNIYQVISTKISILTYSLCIYYIILIYYLWSNNLYDYGVNMLSKKASRCLINLVQTNHNFKVFYMVPLFYDTL